ncbi:conserved hypothetical protein [Roseibium sp. TrichSKD4]|uniref:hypothetical protein n=1 Tax=Roseibium sp. TrichSKD4 TaxID=744980 RepID=UPI0001E57553|nr:hypothetical protein [Roseibium sp. TrichSKD4]EFO29371.1 conserved hypothetical protein [Roseibium sp. TrichSKD4]
MNIDTEKFLAGVFSTIIGGVLWLIRRVITNERQIALLEQALKARDDDLKEMKQDIKHLIGRGPAGDG